MKKTFLPKVAAGFLLLITAIGTQAQNKINLQFRPENKSKYVMTAQMNTVSTQMGMDMKMNISTTTTINVTSQKPNSLLNFEYQNISSDADMMGNKIKFNSDSSGKENESLKKLTHKPFQLLVDEKGKILQIKGLDSVMKDLSNAQNSMLNENNIKSLMEQSFSFLPDHAVAIGESWKNSFDLIANVKMKADFVYTLEKVENNIAYIKTTANMVTDGAQKIKINGMEVEMTMKGVQNGEVLVDTKTGMFTSNTATQQLEGSVAVMGQEIPVTVKSDIVNTVKKQ